MKTISGKSFSAADERMAAKIANDISEDIDCGESREVLRGSISYWACIASELAIEVSHAKTRRLIEFLESLSDVPR